MSPLGYRRAVFGALLAMVVVLVSAGGAGARRRAVPPLHPLSNYEYTYPAGARGRHAKIYVQLVTTWTGRGIYTLQISTRCNLPDGNPFIEQSEEVGAEVEPIGPTGRFEFLDVFPPPAPDEPVNLEGAVAGRELNRNTIALSFAITRNDNCKVVRYPRGNRYGIKLRYTGPFQ